MDINEKSCLVSICMWLQTTEEYKKYEITDERSIFYLTSPLQYAKLIYRFTKSDDTKKLKEIIENLKE